MVVDLEIMSSRESRSRVAHWSGTMQKIDTSARRTWRFTGWRKAVLIPTKLTDNNWVINRLEGFVCSSDTGLRHPVPMPSGFARPHDEHGHVQVVAHRVDGVSENQVLESAMPVRPHNHQVGPNLMCIAHDLLPRRS